MGKNFAMAERSDVLVGVGAEPDTGDEIITRSQGAGWWSGGVITFGRHPP